MKFANPLSVDCPACGGTANYDSKHLLALSANCVRCGASLRAIGEGMREQIKDWVGYVARIEIALELERIFGIEITDAELERIEVPSDFVTLVSALAPAIAHHQAAAQVLSALTRARREKTDAAELNQTFTELFSAHEDG